MRVRLILNPTASATTGSLREQLVGLLEAEVDLSVVPTRARLHAAELARDAVQDGVDAVFALGGDGTVNEVLQGVAGSDVPLGVLPGGATNVIARALGLARSPTTAATSQLQQLHRGAARPLGLGRVEGRWFAFQAGIGLDAAIVERVERNARTKRALGQWAFVLLGLREWATSPDRNDPACRVVHPPGFDDEPQMLVSVANLSPYTYLGPRAFRLVPRAGPDSALSLVTAPPMPTWRALRVVARAFADASHGRDPALRLTHDLDRVVVRSQRPVPLMADGDLVDHVTTATFRHHPAAVRVLTAA